MKVSSWFWVSACVLAVGCGAKSTDAEGSASAKAETTAKKPSASATSSASAAPAAGADLSVLGGPDFHAVFTGPAPVKLKESLGGGQGSGTADDYTRRTGYPETWKYNAAGGGGVYWAPSGKAVAVGNYNLKRDADAKAIDLWIKSALVTDVKQTAGPEVVEVGEKKALANTGAGTCKLKTGEPADFYWWDIYSPGDFAHDLMIVVVAKDAPEEDKKVALSILRQVEYTPKAKPYFKKK